MQEIFIVYYRLQYNILYIAASYGRSRKKLAVQGLAKLLAVDKSLCDSGKSLVSLGPFPLLNKTKVWAG